jgi:hypothetical protein
MDLHHYPHPQNPVQYVPVDLDSREPLSETETEALIIAQRELIIERNRVQDNLRRVVQRLVLSAERKVREAREAGNG